MKIKDGFVLREMCGEYIVAAEGLQHINFNKLISLNNVHNPFNFSIKQI